MWRLCAVTTHDFRDRIGNRIDHGSKLEWALPFGYFGFVTLSKRLLNDLSTLYAYFVTVHRWPPPGRSWWAVRT